MPVPVVYRKSTPLTRNVDFIDVVTGKGFQTFFAGKISGAILTSFVFNSNHSSGGSYTHFTPTAGATFEKDLDMDFDTETLSLPLTVDGSAILDVAIGNDSGSTNTFTVFVVGRISIWDGTTETLIGTAEGEAYTFDQLSASASAERTGVQIPLPRTIIKKGESLRLGVEVWTKDATGGTAHLNHDPAGKEIDNESTDTIMKLTIPIKLDL